jgi:uncharacterized protein (TIGR03083 family)
MNVIHLARDERADFLGFLAGLTPEQWDAPSLCEGWRVRDVVAHVISYEGLRGRELLRRLARGGFRLTGTNAVGVAETRDAGPDELLARLEQRLEPQGITGGFGCRVALLAR